MEAIEKNLRRLLQAIEEGDVATVRALLESGNVDVNGVDLGDGSTPLHAASSRGHLPVVESLLAAGADPSAADEDGYTPLLIAAFQGHLLVVELLLTAGADPNARDKYGSISLHHASESGHLQLVQALLAAGADPSIADEYGTIPLHRASSRGHLPVVELLLTAGADPNAAEKDGWTPLHRASFQGHLPVVKLLLTTGADPNTADKDGCAPLHRASLEGRLPVVQLLLTAGANPNAARKDGWTPLHVASSEGHSQVMELLVKAGQDPNVANKNTGETPLHMACEYAQSDAVRALLALGADLHAEDSEGREPLHFCIRPDRYGGGLTETKLRTLQVLVSLGATWDLKCDELVSSGKAREEAPALRICMSLWSQELADGVPFTKVPLEVIQRGADSTQVYINDLNKTREIMRKIPRAVVERGAHITQASIDDLKKSKEIVFRRKICLVGSSCAGKTSLVKSIISEQPQLEHVDDRTIGIDHFPLHFFESSTAGSDDKDKIHEVTFWDFAGQDAYQVAHSLFFSRRTLYLVCVDLGAFAIAYMQAVIFADHDFQETKLLDEFVEDSVMRWVRMIVARQPDAEFVFIATKEDTLADNKVTEELLKDNLKNKLKQVNKKARQMKVPKEKDTRLEDDNSMDLAGWWKKGAKAVQWVADQLSTEDQDIPTHASKGRVKVAPTEPTVVFVSCTSLASTQDARTKIKDLIIKSDSSFEMPDTYTRVLKEIVQIREAAKTKGIATRIAQVFAPMDSLPSKLGVEPALCRSILQTLHDLGDVLWYEDLGVALFGNTVILEPLLLIDFIREVFNHKNTGQILPHGDLKAMDYWVALDAGDDGSKKKQMKAMKQVLQAFHLVYSADEYRVMEWDSDLIVPAFWQTKMPASWKFLGDILWINSTRSHEGEAVRVHWEYHFESGLPPPLFDHLVVASVSPSFEFDAGPDWIMYREEEIAACRIMVGRDPRSLHRTVEVEAVVSETASPEQVENLWASFQQLSGAFVKVLREYPGLPVSSFAWTDTKCKRNMKDLLWSTSSRPSGKWMPPAETWGWFKRLATGQARARTIEEDWEGM